MKKGNRKKFCFTFNIIYIIILILACFPSISSAISCSSPTAAQLCVGTDDESYVYINGNTPIYFKGATATVCVSIPLSYLNLTGTNVIAVRNNNTIAGYVWSSWVLTLTCAGGTTAYVTSSDGNVTYYNQSTDVSAPPANDGSSLTWYAPAYSNTTGWGTPQYVTNPAATWYYPAIDPVSGNYLEPLSYSPWGGDAPGLPAQSPAGQVLYFRQSFTLLSPVAITKTINKHIFNLHETVTYCFNYTNPEAAGRTFSLWDTIPAVTDFIGCSSGCTVNTYGSNVVVNWNLTVPAGGSGSVCVYAGANRYP
jgi:hypothetical protein